MTAQPMPPAQPILVDFEGAAPIPVGHEVEVVKFEIPKAKRHTTATGILLTDRTTGVVYGASWMYRPEGMMVESGPVPMGLLQGMKVEGQLRGRVVFCRIVTTPSKHEDMRTTLGIDTSPPAAYR